MARITLRVCWSEVIPHVTMIQVDAPNPEAAVEKLVDQCHLATDGWGLLASEVDRAGVGLNTAEVSPVEKESLWKRLTKKGAKLVGFTDPLSVPFSYVAINRIDRPTRKHGAKKKGLIK